MKRRLVVIAVASLLTVIAACGDDEKDEEDGQIKRDEAAQALSTADAGCSNEHPHRLPVEPRHQSGFARFCASGDLTSIVGENTSTKVLRVWTPAGSAPTDLKVWSPSVQDAGAYAALQAVPARCERNYADCVVPAEATVSANSERPVRLNFSVLAEETIEANAARGLAAWLEGKLTTRGGAFAKVQGCATSAGGLANDSPYLEDALRTALTTSATCGGLLSDVLREAGLNPKASRPQALDEVIGVTRKLAGGTFTDELVYGTLRILPRVP